MGQGLESALISCLRIDFGVHIMEHMWSDVVKCRLQDHDLTNCVQVSTALMAKHYAYFVVFGETESDFWH